LHPAHPFAVRQTGFLLTQTNIDTFTDDEIDAWEDTLDLWFDMHPDAPTL
jgi:hypothetical protein